MRIIKFILLTLFPIILLAQGSPPLTQANGELEHLFSGGFFTEGPAAVETGEVFFSDLTFTEETNMDAGNIWVYSPQDGTTKIYRSPSGMSNGMDIDPDGNLITCEGADFGGRRIIQTDLTTGKSKIIAAFYNGKQFNSPNDLVIAKDGTIYFTDPRYVGHEKIEQPVMGVYRINSDGTVALLIKNISMPNGIALSPNEEKLYVGCNDESDPSDNSNGLLNGMFVAAYNLKSDGAAVFERKIIVYDNNLGPDGITVDENGNLYIAVRDETNPRIDIVNPAGEKINEISLPEVPSNSAFGKNVWKEFLYITAGRSLYRIKCK